MYSVKLRRSWVELNKIQYNNNKLGTWELGTWNRRNLVELGGTWWNLAELGGTWRNLAELGGTWWNLAELGGTWNLELGTRNLELGTRNSELGTWNLAELGGIWRNLAELGTRNLELGGTWIRVSQSCVPHLRIHYYSWTMATPTTNKIHFESLIPHNISTSFCRWPTPTVK